MVCHLKELRLTDFREKTAKKFPPFIFRHRSNPVFMRCSGLYCRVVIGRTENKRLIRTDKLSKYQFALRVNAHAACS